MYFTHDLSVKKMMKKSCLSVSVLAVLFVVVLSFSSERS